MRKRKASHTLEKYAYFFPQDANKCMIDAATIGSIKAVECYSARPNATQEELELEALDACALYKTRLSYRTFTNRYDVYTKLTQAAYAQGYGTQQKIYQNDSKAYETQKSLLESFGFEGLFTFWQKQYTSAFAQEVRACLEA